MSRSEAAEQVAREFHETYERLAPEHGYETRPDSAKPWDDVPEQNKGLMCAVVEELLTRGVVSSPLDNETDAGGPNSLDQAEVVGVSPDELVHELATGAAASNRESNCVFILAVEDIPAEKVGDCVRLKTQIEGALATILDNEDITSGRIKVAAGGCAVS